jgi:4-amino-4-deoxy-L-arabinose transferase-like glycosyltransferase
VLRFSGWLLPAILLCSFVTLGAWAILTTSLTLDEPTYIQAGLSYWQGNFTPNPEHPPVAKELIALPVVFLRAIGAISAPTSDLSLVPLYRLTSLLAGLGTVAVCGWWAWRLWRSRAAALTSMALAAFEPNLLANAGVATLDSFLTFFCALSAYLLWSSRTRAPTIRSAVAIGLVFGCAVGTKTSAIVLLPVVVFLTRPEVALRGAGWPAYLRAYLVRLSVLAAAAGVALFAVHGFSHPEQLWLGTVWQLGHAQSGHNAFLFGEHSGEGWLHYYAVAFVVKTPMPTLVAIVAGIIAVVRSTNRDAVAALVILPMLILVVTSLSYIDIGVRNVLPMYPLLLVGAGGLASAPGLRRARWIPLVLVTGAALSVLRIAPHTLSYFNEAAGGPESGRFLLSDSNLDWGQDLKALANYQTAKGLPAIYFAPFTSYSPALYGIRAQVLPAFPLGAPSGTPVVPPDGPQVLAISITTLQGTYLDPHDAYAWLFQREPIARIGYSILAYDITRDADAHDRLGAILAVSGNAAGAESERAKAIAIRSARGK